MWYVFRWKLEVHRHMWPMGDVWFVCRVCGSHDHVFHISLWFKYYRSYHFTMDVGPIFLLHLSINSPPLPTPLLHRNRLRHPPSMSANLLGQIPAITNHPTGPHDRPPCQIFPATSLALTWSGLIIGTQAWSTEPTQLPICSI